MLSNNNQVVIKNLAKASLVHNRRRYLVMFLAILLSAFMLFSVLTVGATYFKMWRIQNLRLNGAEFDAIMYGATDAQLEKLKSNADITDVGVLAIAGFIDGSEKMIWRTLRWCGWMIRIGTRCRHLQRNM